MKRRPLSVIIDTNVIFSGLASPGDNPPGKLLARLKAGQYRLALSSDLYTEYLEISLAKRDLINDIRRRRRAVELSAGGLKKALRGLLHHADIVDPDAKTLHEAAKLVTDKGDVMVAALSLATGSLIVTGNDDDFDPGIKAGKLIVLSPAAFAGMLERGLL